ncbi:MAG: sulfite exporter TauE/SafE family protein [Candidatus Limnocylindrales bacterium]
MSRRRNRAGAQPQVARTTNLTTALDVQAVVAVPDDGLGDAAAIHRRALEMRAYRMGQGARPAGVDAPRTAVAADGSISMTFPVLGMTCRSCEVRIAKFVSKLPNVEHVSASAVRGQVTVESSAPVSAMAIEKAINKAGYELGRTAWLVRDAKVWATAGAGVLLVAALAILASFTGLADLASGAGDLSQGGLVVALLLGLAAGVSTCMALVGGLVLGLSASFTASRTGTASAVAQMRPAAVFVGGRIVGYGVFGAALGAVGASVTMPPLLTAVLMITVAIVMTILGTRLTGLSPRIAGWSPTLPMGVGAKLGLSGSGGAGAYTDRRAGTLGALSFFLPCGFTQAIQIYALSTGSPLFAAALLTTFAIGTAPGLLAVAGLPVMVPSRARPTLMRLVGVVVLGFAFLNGSAGLRLSGFTFPSLVGIANAAPLPGTLGEDGVQRITTNQDAGGYSPANVVIYANYPTQWTIQSSDTATCAASLFVPGVNIRARLTKGPNTFELPALAPGVLNYTCAMGMYGGRITVVAKPVDAPASGSVESPSAATAAAATALPAAVATSTDDPLSRPWSASADPTVTPAATSSATPTPVAAPAVQALRTYQDAGGYTPVDAQIVAGIPTTWTIESRSQASCAAYLVVPSLNIERVLQPGDNVIDLPALDVGTLEYMCGMGMFRGFIEIASPATGLAGSGG